MKLDRCFIWLAVLTAAAIWTGCGDHRHAGADNDEHSVNGAATTDHGFKKDRGVFVSEETRRTIGLELAEPIEKPISRRIEAVARIYAPGKATALLDSENAAALTAGQRVELTMANNLTVTGTLARIDRQLERSLAQAEALVEFKPDESLKPGNTVRAAFPLKGENGVAVPRNSLLHTGEGAFVFVVNGDHLQRTRVQTRGEENGWVQITDGLLAGDVIATNGVQGLWCIELQATKGGAACCPVPSKK